jgi:cytochrome c peroxidase
LARTVAATLGTTVALTPFADDAGLSAAATRAQILAHGPWPPPAASDPSNRVSGHPAAIALGERLFHSARLSTVGGLRCASCHEPWRNFTDGRPKALGAAAGNRNTQSLLNVAQNDWLGWAGANDALWAQSVRPMLDPVEMRSSPAHVARAVRDSVELTAMYVQTFGVTPPEDDEVVLVAVGKVLAAYQETLVSGRTPFDDFRDALRDGNAQALTRYPADARRGLLIFEGRGGCSDCHSGPSFSDGRFHRSLITSLRADGQPDTGRQAGLTLLRESPYRRSGRYGDTSAAEPVAALAPDSSDDLVGAFRTPGLREVAATAPYMHDGSVDNLCDAIRPHALAAPGRAAAEPLSDADRRDLVAFLRSLGTRPDPPLVDKAVYRCR